MQTLLFWATLPTRQDGGRNRDKVYSPLLILLTYRVYKDMFLVFHGVICFVANTKWPGLYNYVDLGLV